MDSRHGKMRMNAESDRLSSLPDDLIHRIFSSLDIKDAIQSSVLSSRWRFVWTSMPYLNLSSDSFSRLPKFSKFVRHVMSRRNNQTEVYSVDLRFHGQANQAFLKRIMKYALSHNIQQLNVECLLENDAEIPLSLFSSPSLKDLSLTMHIGKSDWSIDPGHLTSTWELPTLTTLDLRCVTLCDDNADIFSKCANLKSLTLNQFYTRGSNDFTIFHHRLSNLTLVRSFVGETVNVAAPQLKNFTIIYCDDTKLVITSPNLASLICKGHHRLNLCTDGFHSLETADIFVSHPREEDAHQIFCLLKMLHNVSFLTLSLEIFELLSSSRGLLFHQPSPFKNLKSLKIYPIEVDLQEQTPKKVVMSTEFKSYMLDSSLGCAFTMVFREEIIAKKVMAELRMLLVKAKDNTKTNSGKIYRFDAKMKLKNEGNMAHIKSCWENLGLQIERRRKKACDIISKLQHLEELLIKLPESRRAKIQPCFSSLCAEADIVISNITDCMKIECDENQSRSSAGFHKLATWDVSSMTCAFSEL